MAKEEDTDNILGEELGKLGGEFGGVGARWAAHRMANDAFRASIDLEISADQALAEFIEVASALGRVVEHQERGAEARLRAVIGAGFRNMNPAVVQVQIEPIGPHTCRVTVTGTAKEGLIKQRAGEGAVRKLLGATRFGWVPASDVPER